jgi:hypothetical protein
MAVQEPGLAWLSLGLRELSQESRLQPLHLCAVIAATAGGVKASGRELLYERPQTRWLKITNLSS